MANVDHLLPRVGETVGVYQLVEELARGGFSVVFRALQVSLHADVAIKFLAPPNLGQVRSQQLLERFQQEARVAQQLRHPCAIKLRDYGQTANGLLYQVTDFIDGRVLSEVLKQQPLPVDRTVRIASQVLGCLNEAHGLGIVHRDLKPDNIMLRDFSAERDVVTVLDFGVAKVAQSYDGVVTQAGMTLGTPYYTAPEQCRGERDIDGRADLYALGLIIAECLTGRRVVGMDNPMTAVYIQAGAQPLEFEPALLHSPLFPVLQRATQKKKEWRYADAREMREALELAAHGRLAGSGAYAQVGRHTTPTHRSAVYDAADAAPLTQSYAHPVLRPRRRRSLTWLWVTLALTGVLALAALLVVLVLDEGPQRAVDGVEQTEAATTPAPTRQAEPEEVTGERRLPVPVTEPGRNGPVRARVAFVDDEGSERRVTLTGCGLASGLLVGDRATVGTTGIDLEITRLRDTEQCTARTAATASQLHGITEVLFSGRASP